MLKQDLCGNSASSSGTSLPMTIWLSVLLSVTGLGVWDWYSVYVVLETVLQAVWFVSIIKWLNHNGLIHLLPSKLKDSDLLWGWNWVSLWTSHRKHQVWSILAPCLTVLDTGQTEKGKWRAFTSVGTYTVLDTESLDADLVLENFILEHKKDGGGPK